MIKRLLCLSLFALLSCNAAGAGAAEGRGKPCGDALSARMLELFRDSDERVSLGAMLVSDQILHDECLVRYVLDSRAPGESVRARAVKNFYLAMVRPYFDGPGNGYARAFIDEFPEEPEAFNEVLAFDASLTRTVSGRMVMELTDMAECHRPAEVRAAARAKVERLRETQDKSGWAAEIFPDSFPHCED